MSLTPRRDDWVIPIIAEIASPEAAELARSAADSSAWTAALRLRLVPGHELLAAISTRLSTPIAPSLAADPQAVALIPERVARRHQIVPLAATPHTLDVASATPWDLDAEREITFITGKSIKVWLAPPAAIAEKLDELYSMELRGRAGSRATRADAVADESIVRLVDRIVTSGIERRASDIHLEPEEAGIAVRYRIDGMLRHMMLLPKSVGIPLVSRIKIMARMDIADRLRPQGGHASVTAGKARIDLRVSTLPASHGEKVVIRILDASAAIRSLDALGLDAVDAPRMQRLLEVREGLILVTGPTGSGKTTTLYSALLQIQQRGLNIVTVEDPVEYRIPGVVQVQINEKAGLSFASALRSILRQDPDVVLIGEIRDRETAGIAVQAALTGHLVFATLHTNDACSSITRLRDLGVESERLAAALRGIVAQRLIRRLCDECRIVANDGAPAQLRHSIRHNLMVHTPVGCDSCGMSGYRGRLAVTEIVIASAALDRAIADGATGDALSSIARRNGARSLWESAITHLAAGVTSGDELLRVLEQQPAEAASSADQPASGTRAIVPPAYDSGDESTGERLTELIAGVVDVYVVRPLAEGWKVLTLQRANDTRCPKAWETVHGRLNSGEKPEDGAVREVVEETGLAVARLYNITVQPFYLHMFGAVQFAIVFAAFVDEPADVTLGEEHQRFEWLSPDDAATRFVWPREREALSHIRQLLGAGNAGPVEDVLRVR